MFEASSILIICGTFLIGGFLKGAVGVGLATFCLALLAVLIDLSTAQALLLVPAFVTNVWQASFGGHAITIVKRIWPFLILSSAVVWQSAQVVTRVDISVPTFLLGVALIVYALLILFEIQFEITPRKERWLCPMAGVANGAVTGITGSFVVPGVMYLQALRLPRDAFVQAMGIHFTVATVALALALEANSLLTPGLGVLSAAALIPALIGMVVGQSVRHTMSDHLFRSLFNLSLLTIGIYIAGKTLNQVARNIVDLPDAAEAQVFWIMSSDGVDGR